jgi:membrane fusion protein (multidrug efflux system)
LKSKNLIWAAVLLFALPACSHKKNTPASPSAQGKGGTPEFDAFIATTARVDRRISAPGTILPNENTELHPEINGRVVAINFKEGSFVQKGALLVKLFDDDLQAQMRKLEVQLKVAEATEKRQQELLAINGTSQQDYDLAVLNVSNLKADLELLRVNITKTEIRAPYSGKLGLRNISLGAYVTPVTIVTSISQVNQVKVEFAVPEKYASEMVPGKKVELRSLANNYMATATIVASQNTISPETRNLLVRALLSEGNSRLTPGSFVEVNMEMGNDQPAIMIPSQALIPSTRFKNVIVANEGKAAFKIVTTGYRDSARIEILSGLKEGDTVITSGLLSIKEGMALKARVRS